jgi:hypothetical protein
MEFIAIAVAAYILWLRGFSVIRWLRLRKAYRQRVCGFVPEVHIWELFTDLSYCPPPPAWHPYGKYVYTYMGYEISADDWYMTEKAFLEKHRGQEKLA